MGVVPAQDNDTGDGLISEILGIPMIIRGESSVVLLRDEGKFESAFQGEPIGQILGIPLLTNGRTTSESLGLPTLSKHQKGRAGLFHGTLSERLGLPTLLRGR